MHLTQRFTRFITEENLFSPTSRLLVAVSGGVDSVVLCELCKQCGFSFIMAHCNFQLRGEESMRDEAFVVQLAQQYGVELLHRSFETAQFAQVNKLSVQVAARELRYAWFNDLVNGNVPNAAAGPAPQYIVTAHHADDNIETMLMNFFKGTGIAGMRGMLPKQGKLVRPLLFAHKAALLTFATENNIAYVEDASNAADKYTRNYFRNQLIPAVQKVFPGAEESLYNNLQRFREVEELYRQSVLLHKKKLLAVKGNEVHIPVLLLKKTVPLQTVLYEIIKDYGFTPHQVAEVMGLLESESGKFVQSAAYRIIKHRNWLVISPVDTTAAAIIVINGLHEVINFNNGCLRFRQVAITHGHIEGDALTAQVDATCISFPLLLRKRRQGDYFYPLGMQKKKKVGRFLSDLKLPAPEKENTWVLEMDKKIIWVVGKRIDNRFKITEQTTNVIEISFRPTSP